ncbi:TPA: FGGY-family carbohydrate kinase [Klebsiella pneumoniae]|nr:FGGY-family carbohydrate kinase [Klebsiella pneumoniae]
MSQNCFIGIDVGSASVRAGVFTVAGQRLAFAVRPISQFHPRSNVVEQSSEEIWQAACDAVREAMSLAAVQPQDIRGIGFDATCSLVVVDENGHAISVSEQGEPERDIIMWMDHRATREAADINATADEALQYVGGEVSVEMELPKVLWLKRNFPQRYQKAWRLFDLADYLVWRATGADVASVCTLACKWNYLSHQSRFSQPLLDAIGLSDLPTKIPVTILPPGKKAGYLSAQAASAFGLPSQIVVASGIIDAHAGGLALVGSQPEGNLALIGGTSNCHMLVSREPIMVPGVWGPYWGAMLPDWWLSEGGQSAAGSLVEWTLRQNEAWPELQALAQQREENIYSILNGWVAALEQREPWPTAQLHVLADHHGNRSPRANSLARGALTGLTLELGQDALARLYLATLQAIAYGTRHIIDTMTAAGHCITRITACGGVTKNPLWLREYANITGRDIHLSSEEDAVTLGAAMMGAVASGYYADFPQAASAMVKPGKILRADPTTADFHRAKYQLYLQMYQQQQQAADVMQAWINP